MKSHDTSTDSVRETTHPVVTEDDHRFSLIHFAPDRPESALYWLPALGVSARQYRPFARELAARGITTWLHEWRGAGSSSLRAARDCDWGYREVLDDIAAGLESLPADAGRPVLAGHSLGAQLAALELARVPASGRALAIVAGGLPHWPLFPPPMGWLMPAAFWFIRGLSAIVGHFPGRRLGFAGREARGLMRDWARSGLTGRYRPEKMKTDFDARLAALELPVFALRFGGDRLAPKPSLEALLERMPWVRVERHELNATDFTNAHADHFSWMREPGPVAERLAGWMLG